MLSGQPPPDLPRSSGEESVRVLQSFAYAMICHTFFTQITGPAGVALAMTDKALFLPGRDAWPTGGIGLRACQWARFLRSEQGRLIRQAAAHPARHTSERETSQCVDLVDLRSSNC